MLLFGGGPSPSSFAVPLAKRLVSSHRVAQALEWNKESGSILSLCIQRERIDLAVASHPAAPVPAVQSLPSLAVHAETEAESESWSSAAASASSSLARRKSKATLLNPSLGRELSDLIREWSVCGVVVHWPIQKDGGWCGAPCGRVLYTLDRLAAQKALLTNRPLCLWDAKHHQPCEDSWGRSPLYARPSSKALHVASQEQYVAPHAAAEDVWHDFCRSHWPELHHQRRHQPLQAAAERRGAVGRVGEGGASDRLRSGSGGAAATPVWLYSKSPL